jgi:hypothetical protein
MKFDEVAISKLEAYPKDVNNNTQGKIIKIMYFYFKRVY